MKDFDDVLKQIGEFGRYQKWLYLLLSLPGIFCGLQGINTLVFMFAVPKHRCSIPGVENDTYEIQDAAHELMVNLTIPRVSGLYGEEEYSSCGLYSSSNTSDVWSAGVSNTTLSCSTWVYDRSQFTSTVAESMDLVCDRRHLVSVGKMMLMLGQFISALYNGPLADTFGRRPVIIFNIFLMVSTSISMTWVQSIAVMFVLEIFYFQFSMGQYMACFVFGMEIVAPSKRMWTGITMNLFWSAGNFIIALEAYLWRDWRTRQLIASLPGILYAYVYFLPESPRWLLDNGKVKEAKSILMRIAKGNNKELAQDMLDALTEKVLEKEHFWHLFKSKILLRRMIIVCYCWFVISISFYGLSMNVTNLSGDIYLNFSLFALIEVFAYLVCYLFMNRLGRKKLLCIFLLATGVACITPLIPVLAMDRPNPWVINILAMIGNTFASVTFAVVFTFTSELMPTSIRNSCMSLGSLSGRTGSLIAPYIVDLTLYVKGRYGQILPMMIFGGMTALAGFLCFYLPETANKRLPETIKEAEKLGTAAYDLTVHEEGELPWLSGDKSEIKETTIISSCR